MKTLKSCISKRCQPLKKIKLDVSIWCNRQICVEFRATSQLRQNIQISVAIVLQESSYQVIWKTTKIKLKYFLDDERVMDGGVQTFFCILFQKYFL